MDLNVLIIGAMVLLMAIGGCIVEVVNYFEDRERRTTKDIWGVRL